MRLACLVAGVTAAMSFGGVAHAQSPAEPDVCSGELRAENTARSLTEEAIAGIVTNAMEARVGLPCVTYARMVESAVSDLSNYLDEPKPGHPEAFEAARNGRLMEARAYYAEAVAATDTRRTLHAATDLEEAAWLALAASDFDTATGLLSRAAELSRRASEARQAYQEQLARALSLSADFYGDMNALNGALAIYRQLSIEINRDDPRWADIQASLALAVFTQADQTTDPTQRVVLLENATALLRAVSEVRQSLATPTLWARTQFNLGLALVELARRDSLSGRADIEEAITAFNNALAVYEPELNPRLWAQIQRRLGIALMMLSTSERDAQDRKSDLHNALQCFQRAAELRPRTASPDDWAETQLEIARAYLELAKLAGNADEAPGFLREAANASRASLEVLTMERSPAAWALSEMNLGEALLTMRDTGDDLILDAIGAFEAAQRVHTRETDPHNWGRANLFIAIAHARSAERGDRSRWRLARSAAADALAAFETAGADRDAQFARSFLQSFPAN